MLVLLLTGCGVLGFGSGDDPTEPEVPSSLPTGVTVPTDVVAMPAFLLEFGADPDVVDAALASLRLAVERSADELVLPPLGSASVATTGSVPSPDFDVTINRAIVRSGVATLDQVAAVLMRGDQSYRTGGGSHVRTVDGGGLLGGETGMTGMDDVSFSSFGVTTDYELRFAYERTSAGIVGRRWLERVDCPAETSSCVLQSWGVEVFLPTSTGFTALVGIWTEQDSPIAVGDDILGDALVNSLQTFVENLDAER